MCSASAGSNALANGMYRKCEGVGANVLMEAQQPQFERTLRCFDSIRHGRLRGRSHQVASLPRRRFCLASLTIGVVFRARAMCTEQEQRPTSLDVGRSLEAANHRARWIGAAGCSCSSAEQRRERSAPDLTVLYGLQACSCCTLPRVGAARGPCRQYPAASGQCWTHLGPGTHGGSLGRRAGV